MPASIKCPNCSFEFEPTDLIREEIQKEVNTKAEEWKKKKEKELEESLRKNISSDFENKLRLLEQNNKESEEKLKESRRKELEFLKKEQELKTKEAELDITVQKKLQQEREKLSEELRKLEEMLRTAFPFDMITEVGKGVRGADCIQTVRNNFGQECGKIIFESKRTKDFGADWIEKLKKDMRSQSADVAVIVTQVLPKDMTHFGEKDGVWICSFSEVKPLTHMLREGIIKISNAVKSQENKGDKMHLLYDYLTGSEFAEQWKAIREGFLSMKHSIQKERDAMEKLWKSREKQLEKVLLSAAHFRGSIEGISGMDAIDLNLLEDNSPIDSLEL